MHEGNRLHQAFATKPVVRGALIATGSPIVAEIAARSGFDYLIVDGEHGNRAADLNSLYRAIALTCSPVYRASRLDPGEIGYACDLGFEAILVPNVRSVEEAQACVSATRHPPAGRRGYAGPLVRASGYGALADGDIIHPLVIPMIESREGIEAARAIADVDGVAGLMVGHSDLALDLVSSLDIRSASFLAALAKLEDAARQTGKWLGAACMPDALAGLQKRGYRMMMMGTDIAAIYSSFDRIVR